MIGVSKDLYHKDLYHISSIPLELMWYTPRADVVKIRTWGAMYVVKIRTRVAIRD
jgi:hypothetical protein